MAFNDLQAQRRHLGGGIDRAIAKVLDHGRFIMGPEVRELEEALATRAGARHTITCASGTDALVLALSALGIGAGDAVLVPAFTFAASAEAVATVGATPLFVDSEEATFNIDVQSAERGADAAVALGLRVRAVMPVDLFGQPAEYDAVGALAARLGMTVVADAAQSFGATFRERPVGSIASVTTTSFFPSKPLGCYGDGGAIFTDDDDLAATLRSVRVHGQGADKYDNVRLGTNSRLDTIQAAILLEKLTVFDDELAARDRIAARYDDLLRHVVDTPQVRAGSTSAWAQYTIRVPRRDDVAAALQAAGIPTAIYYPKPLNEQLAFADAPVAPGGVPVAEALARDVLSLPFHPYLDDSEIERVAREVTRAVDGG